MVDVRLCHACHAKRLWMRDCATPAAWNESGCHACHAKRWWMWDCATPDKVVYVWVCVKLLYVKFVCVKLLYVREGMWQSCVCECVWSYCTLNLCVCEVMVCERWGVTKLCMCECVWSYCMLNLCVCVCEVLVCEKVVCEVIVCLCVWNYCMWEMVCDKVVCVCECVWSYCMLSLCVLSYCMWEMVLVWEAGGGEGARDTESKTRTPHKVVGKNQNKNV